MKMRHIALALTLFLASANLAPADAPEEFFFDSDGVQIRYIVSGDGAPVLLIHGYTASAEMNWGSVIPALSKKYKVIALDNRGHGKSGKPDDPNAYDEEMVKDSINLLDHLEIEKAHIVGYSMGGYITAKMTTMHPDRMLSATIGGAGWARDEPERNGMLDLLADTIETEGNLAPLFTALSPEGEPMPDAQVKAFSNMILQSNDPKALANVARGMKGHAVAKEELEKVDVPTMLIIGAKDPLKETADAWMSVQTDDQYVVLDGADHMTAFANPKFLASIEEFLTATPSD